MSAIVKVAYKLQRKAKLFNKQEGAFFPTGIPYNS